MPKVLNFLWSEVNFGWLQWETSCLQCVKHAMTSSLYTNKPLGWPELANARDMTRWNIQGAFAIPKGRTLKTYLPFDVKKCCFVTVLLRYRYLPVSTLYVANCDEIRTTYCVDIRLNIRHRPCLANKELVNSSPVIDTETR